MDKDIIDLVRLVFVPDKYYTMPNMPAVKSDGSASRGLWG